MDEWGNFPRECTRLIDLAEKTGNAILLSGNVHFAEISRLAAPGGLVKLTSSGMTHTNELYAKAPNSHRIAGPSIDLNFGLVEIDWESGLVVLSASTDDGKNIFAYELSIRSLAAPR